MFVTQEALKELTDKERPSAQARFLRARFPKILFIFRDDGSIALRQEELDRWTLTKPPEVKRRRALDLSLLKKAG
jgi:hypothetical protein